MCASLWTELRPLSEGVMALPSTAVRPDLGVLVTLGARYPGAFLKVLRDASKITAPFDLDAYGVKDAFLKNYLDLIAFLLQARRSSNRVTQEGEWEARKASGAPWVPLQMGSRRR